ncbi:PAS domain S-box protein [Haloarcula salina]|uniref:PAS domain S-box protein n=1 Tax=Haloarcula salina TaxID=1429914 RepID=UPI003C6EE568
MELPAVVLYVGAEDGADAVRRRLADGDGVTVEVAAGQRDALAVIESETVDCVVTEQSLREGDGLSLLRAVRAADPSLPVLLFAPADEGLAREALASDVTGFVPRAGDAGPDLLVARVEAVIEHRSTERRATRYEHIAAVTRKVNRALLWARDRRTLEARVCRIITESEPYRFAWIGCHDPETDAIEPRAGGGDEQGYLDEIAVTAAETEHGRGPAGRAIRTGDIQICQDIEHDPSFEPWREAALERGFRSVAAVPLTYDGESYGALFVYADRTDAFDAPERELLSDIGRDIAYATNTLELRDEVEKLAEFFEHAPVGVFVTESVEGGVVLEANPELARLLGAECPDDIVGRQVVDVYANPAERENVLEAIRERGKVSRELELETVSGQTVWGLLTLIQSEQRDGQPVIVGMVKDITGKKHIQERLGEQLAFIESVLESSPVAIAVLDRDGTVLRANGYAKEVLGLETVEILGRPTEGTEWRVFDDRTDLLDVDDLPFDHVVSTGEPVYGHEHAVEQSDGETVWLSTNMVPMTNGDGEVVRAVAAIADVTELRRKEAELEARQSQIAFFNNLLRHEVLNGMTVVLGATERLMDALDEGDERRALVEQIDGRGVEMVDTVQRVRRVLRQIADESPEIEPHDIASIVDDCASRLEADYPAAAVTVDAPATAPVLADELLEEVVYNVLVNAVEHNDADDPSAWVSVAVDGETTAVSIEDDGPGIDPTIRDRVFGRDGLHTTPVSASGFGLHFVETMVTRYGGSVRVEDRDPRGTRVVVELPTADGDWPGPAAPHEGR